MGIIGNRALQGQPILPYPAVKSYQDTDVFFDLAFVDHTQTPVTPTAITIGIDDLTNSITMLSTVTLAAAGSTTPPLVYTAFAPTMVLSVQGVLWQMSFPYEGSQLCQVTMAFTAIDSVTGLSFTSKAVVAVVELCAIQTVSGS